MITYLSTPNQILAAQEILTQKFEQAFEKLNIESLNLKSTSTTWSIGEVLDHLIVTDTSYFSQFNKILDKKYAASLWQSPHRRDQEVTLMETYATPGGIDTDVAGAIERETSSCAVWLRGQRHCEWFDPL